MRRNLVQNLVEHGEIRTTLAKAKDVRPFAEKMVTLARKAHDAAKKKDALAALRYRRLLHHYLSDRAIIPKEHQEAYDGMSDIMRERTLRMASGRRHRTGEPRGRLTFTAESVIRRLIDVVAPKFVDRPGGYTRVIRLPDRRVGDHSPLAILQFVGNEEAPTGVAKAQRGARRRRADSRYGFAAKTVKAAAAST